MVSKVILKLIRYQKWEVNEGSETLFYGLKFDRISKILISYQKY